MERSFVKRLFRRRLEISPFAQFCHYSGKALKADDVLSDLGVAPNETIQLDVVSTDPDIVLVKPSKAKPLTSSDVITVRLVKGNSVC